MYVAWQEQLPSLEMVPYPHRVQITIMPVLYRNLIPVNTVLELVFPELVPCFVPVERSCTQWTEGPACLLCHNHGDQPVLHHVHWSSEWVSLFHLGLHACPQPQLKINCSLRQPDAHTYSRLNQTVFTVFTEAVFILTCFWASLACGCMWVIAGMKF